jgi:hypothetical protein
MRETQSRRRPGVKALIAAATAGLLMASGLISVPTAASAVEPGVQSASLSWGVKSSFADYIKSSVAKGTITNLGTTTGQFAWANGTGTASADASAFDVSFGAGNGMRFLGHAMEGGSALDMQYTNPRVKLTSATTADLYLDVKSRKYEGTTTVSSEYFEQSGVLFATVSLPKPTVKGSTATWTKAATQLTAAGSQAFGGFYPAGSALDPLTLNVSSWKPALQVFFADGVTPVGNSPVYAGDTLVVKGAGFDPAANVGGRGVPIPNTLPQGDYVVFGHFAADWKPSSGAASAGRKVGVQAWALTANTVNAVPAQFQATVRKEWTELAADGSFSWQVKLKGPADLVDGGSYGIYSYAGGGVKNTIQELAVPLNYSSSVRTTTTLATSPASPSKSGAPVKLTATVSATEGAPAGTITFMNGATQLGQPQELVGNTASVTVSDLPVGTASLKAVFAPADTQQFAGSTSKPMTFKVVSGDPPIKRIIFTDVQKGDKFFTEISWMASSGISTGTKQSDGSYKFLPADSVSREAMAAFLYREAKASYKGPGVSPFADVKPGDKFYNEIAWMHKERISTGTKQPSGKPLFKPKDGISREAMAAFMYRIDAGPKPKVPAASPFADVSTGDKFFREIAWMYTSKLSTGSKQPTGKPRYEGKANVSRAAMAAFLYRKAH